MLLLIDIGNSDTSIGFYDNDRVVRVLRLKTVPGGRDAEEFSYILKGYISHHEMQAPDGAALCSVVPGVTPFLSEAIKSTFNIEAVHVDSNAGTGLTFSIENSAELGADRIANAAAAHKLYKGNVIVIDFGTATTLCVITEKGAFMGGAIMTGVALSALTLAEKTSKLPEIELKQPDSVIGKSTLENIRAGAVIGHAGAVERIISDIKIETGMDFTVLATGGLTGLVAPNIKAIDHINPDLTFEGLKIIYELNS